MVSNLRRRKVDSLSKLDENSESKKSFLPQDADSNAKRFKKLSFNKINSHLVLKSIRRRTTTPLWLTSNRADALLAGLGISISLSLLRYSEKRIEEVLDYELHLHASFLIGSASAFFFNRVPPSLASFTQSTIVAILVGSVIYFLPSSFDGERDTVCIFTMIVFWKLYGNVFGPAGTLASLLSARSSPNLPFIFLATTYLSSHMILYGLACLLSKIRLAIRFKLLKREFTRVESSFLKGLSPEEQNNKLLASFQKMDLDGSGVLEVEEFQLALSTTLKEEFSLEDAKRLMSFFDVNGNGVIDFDEYKLAIDTILCR